MRRARVLPGGKPEGSCIRTIHAESNALDLAGPLGAEAHTLFCSVIPCRDCALRLIQAGISRVVFHEFYDSRGSHETLELFGVPKTSLGRAYLKELGEKAPAGVRKLKLEPLVAVTHYLAPREVVCPTFADPDGAAPST